MEIAKHLRKRYGMSYDAVHTQLQIGSFIWHIKFFGFTWNSRKKVLQAELLRPISSRQIHIPMQKIHQLQRPMKQLPKTSSASHPTQTATHRRAHRGLWMYHQQSVKLTMLIQMRHALHFGGSLIFEFVKMRNYVSEAQLMPSALRTVSNWALVLFKRKMRCLLTIRETWKTKRMRLIEPRFYESYAASAAAGFGSKWKWGTDATIECQNKRYKCSINWCRFVMEWTERSIATATKLSIPNWRRRKRSWIKSMERFWK